MRTNLPAHARRVSRLWIAVIGLVLTSRADAQRLPGCEPTPGSSPGGWIEHLLDASDGCLVDGGGRDGADGVDIADFDLDGDFDVVTGWEESGEIIVGLNPGHGSEDPWDISQPWATVNVDGGDRKQGLEDAVFVDFEGDGLPEVVSAAEQDVREVFLSGTVLNGVRTDPVYWVARDMPGDGKFFMRAQGGDVDLDGDVDIIVGAKDNETSPGIWVDGGIWWYENPHNENGWTPAQGVGSWNRHKIAGDIYWVMEMTLEDMDGDGDRDVLFNDRGKVAWMRNPHIGPGNVRNNDDWKKRIIERAGTLTGGRGNPYRWSHYVNMDSDPAKELVVATNYDFDRGVVARWFDNNRADSDMEDENDTRWTAYEVSVNQIPFGEGQELPFDKDGEGTQTSKAVVAYELDGDGRVDLVLSARGGEHGESGRGVGIYRLRYHPGLSGPPRCGNAAGQTSCSTDSSLKWRYAPIGPSYSPNMKYDNVKVFDADGDEDLDILTVEENVDGKGLGLVAYENVMAPVAQYDTVSTVVGAPPISIHVAANDIDANLDPCSAAPAGPSMAGGTAAAAGCGFIQFTPNPALGAHTDGFAYQICDTDPHSACSNGNVWINVSLPPLSSTVTNGSFESTNQTGDIQHMAAGSTDLPGWTITGGIDVVQTAIWPADEGSKSVDLSGNPGEAGAIHQDLATTPGQTHLLRFALTANPAGAGGPRTAVVTVTSGPTTLVTQTFTTFVYSTGAAPPWAERQIQFVAPGSEVRIRFSTPDSTGSGPVIDDVVLTQVDGGSITASDDFISLQPRIVNFIDVLANDASTTPLELGRVEVTRVGFGLNACLLTQSGYFYGDAPTYLGDGRFELIPHIPCPFGSVDFDYQVCNREGRCDTGRVTVQPQVDTPEAPIAQDDHFEVPLAEDLNGFLFAPLEINDLDANCVSGFHCTGEAITIVQPPAYGDVVQTYPNIYFLDPEAVLPPAPFDETFRYQICDSDGLCSQAQVTIRVLPEPGFAALIAGGAAGLAAIDRRRRRVRRREIVRATEARTDD